MLKKVKYWLILLLFCYVGTSFATHERAGEITFRHISGTTYEFTVLTYTYSVSLADRPLLDIEWGDGYSDKIQRVSKVYLGNDINRNVYVKRHTFPAAGSYKVSVLDENRNQGIVNIPNSVNVPFYIETIITINSFITPNNSPVLHNPPIDKGCVGVPYYHNPIAVDPDGDSLAYSLVDCRGYNGQFIPGYQMPLTNNSISIDPITGDFVWDLPIMQGEYNIAILIEEFRNGIKIGSIIRDMQIDISACDNRPPEIYTISDTCVEAGTLLSFGVTAKDTTFQVVTLTGMGEPFLLNNSPAHFDSTSYLETVSDTFHWFTDCSHVRVLPYWVTFKAVDNGFLINLVNLKTISITVVSPAPEQLQANALGNTIALSWQHSPCHQYAEKYLIYRRIGKSGFNPNHCETGIPPYTGYTLIGSVPIAQTSFIDDNNGKGLTDATEYCYLITACFPDKGESYASNEACAICPKINPIITEISISKTSTDSGEIDISWLKPSDFDSIQFYGTYFFELYCSINDTSNFVLLDSFPDAIKTSYTHNLQNTEENVFFYRVKMFVVQNGGTYFMGQSDISSSVFLQATPQNNSAYLFWNEIVAWQNYQYIVYRYNEQTSNFDSIALVTNNFYTDINLLNKHLYTYLVQSYGNYSDTTIERPLLNFSQEITIIPSDNEVPCCPILCGQTDCEIIDLQWNINTCSTNDIEKFYIYYKPDLKSNFEIVDSVPFNTTTYQIVNSGSVVGCWLVTSVDTNGNENVNCDTICFDVDLCDNYKLPNIFSPNGDGINDLFIPYDIKYVESANTYIYNRWGNLIFKTDDPYINWDGTNQQTGKPCVDGVYYYVCLVNEKTLNGIITKQITGSITLVR